MKKQIPAYLLKKYLKGQCTTDEELLVEDWYNSFEQNDDHVSAIHDIDKQELKHRIRSRIDDRIGLSGPGTTRRTNIYKLAYTLSGIAAIALIVLLILPKHRKNTLSGQELVTVTNISRNIREQVLSDGSHVWLMPGARITYNRQFTGNTRAVGLTGESFFEVTKNPAKPFIITSGNLITKVWGTSFRIRDSGSLSYADVTVVTGKVSVRLAHPEAIGQQHKSDEVMIYPNQQVTYLKKQQSFTPKPKADMQSLAIWKKPTMAFDNKPLKEVIPVLDKTFGLTIVAANDKISNYLLSADFTGMNFPQIMEIMHKALYVNYEIKGLQVILKEANNQ